MDKTDTKEDFDIDLWANAHALNEITMDKLKEQDIFNEITLKALHYTDIQDLGLNIGQRAALRSALGTLRKDSDPVVDLSVAAAPPTQSDSSGTEHGSSSIRLIFYMYQNV